MGDQIPPCNIKIDKDGVWYYRGGEIFRKEIVHYLYQHLRRDDTGRFLIVLEEECCYLDVEDTPFVVKSVSKLVSDENREEYIQLLLSDGNFEKLNPDTLWIGNDNVLYCTIRNKAFKARFTRPSYYQIVQFIEHDTKRDEYFISLNGNVYYLRGKEP
jgi:hypothetical protein